MLPLLTAPAAESAPPRCCCCCCCWWLSSSGKRGSCRSVSSNKERLSTRMASIMGASGPRFGCGVGAAAAIVVDCQQQLSTTLLAGEARNWG